MNLQNKKIGIWGFGVVGKAALKYFSQQGISTNVLNAKNLSPDELQLLKSCGSLFFKQKNIEVFLQSHDLILASPGIDLRPFNAFKDKFITELDIFYQAFKKPIIAITGTVGKTSITHLLATILNAQKKICTGGNIGLGMLDLLQQKHSVDAALLELSSFQLEYCTAFAPDLAILTNFYPNHLDRHKTVQTYFAAKANILAYQSETQQALIPLELVEKITVPPFKQQLHFFSPEKPKEFIIKKFPRSRFFWLENNCVQQRHLSSCTTLINLTKVPAITFPENWLIIYATLSLLELSQPHETLLSTLTVPAHRVEKIATINHIDFYNDSKSTLIEATIAAAKKLQGKPILLFLGGTSKGVDRSKALKKLKSLVAAIFCFGSEAAPLHKQAQRLSIPSFAYTTLEEAFNEAVKKATPGDQILFSPSGASFDLFAHYEERGDCFKKLVIKYQHSLQQ